MAKLPNVPRTVLRLKSDHQDNEQHQTHVGQGADERQQAFDPGQTGKRKRETDT